MNRFHYSLAMVFLTTILGHSQDSPKPATALEIKQAIDWDKLPLLENATKLHIALATASYEAPGTFLQAAEFYRKHLPALGWKEDTTPIPGVDQKSYLSLSFDKGAMRLNISGYRAEANGPMTITMVNAGNVDMRKMPRIEDAKVKSAYPSAVVFTSPSKREAVAAFCRNRFKELGWQEGHEESAAFHAKEGRIVMRFLCNAMEVTVVAYLNKEGETEVTYSVGVQYDLKPEDVAALVGGAKPTATPATLSEATAVIDFTKLPRLEGAEKLKQHQELMILPWAGYYQAPATVETAAKFYRKLLKEQGWKELASEVELEHMAQLKYEKAGYLIKIGIGKREALVQVSLANTGNVDLRLLPFPEGARFSPQRTDFINFTSTLDRDAVFAFYRQGLPKLGWKNAESKGQGTLRFTHQSIELRLEIGKSTSGTTPVKITTSMR